LGACSAAPDAPLTTVRDSAGVRIVDHTFGEAELPVFASIGDADLTIGVQEGDEAYTFGRIVDVRALEDGGVVVADGQDRTIRVYGSEGEHRVTVGGAGGGPGELGALTGIVEADLHGIRVFDSRNQRITHYDLDGELVSASTLDGPRASTVARFPDGSYLIMSRWRSGAQSAVNSDLRLNRDSIVLHRFDADGAEVDTVAVLPSAEMVTERRDFGGGRVGVLLTPRPFGARGYSVPTGDGGILSAWSETFELVVRGSSGDPATIVRVTDVQQVLETSDVERLKAQRLSEIDEPEFLRVTERLFDEIPLPELVPAFSDVKIDILGNYWVAEYATPPEEVTTWLVFAPTGEILGHVWQPPGLDIREIGLDYLLGVESDELEVQYVKRYRLERMAAQG
jgi:hypothetical protein